MSAVSGDAEPVAQTEATPTKAQPAAPGGSKRKEAVYIDTNENGVDRRVLVSKEVENVASEPTLADPAKEDMQTIYMELHRRLAEWLTSEQLIEKSKTVEKELNALIAEDEIEQIQKQLSELKKKNADNKAISTRLHGAIDSLKKSHTRATAEDFRAL